MQDLWSRGEEKLTDDFELMRQGICPVCGARPERHSERKRKICLAIMRQRHGIRPTIVEVDGKHYEVTARKATQEEIRQAEESQT